jgi:hypothetical protein
MAVAKMKRQARRPARRKARSMKKPGALRAELRALLRSKAGAKLKRALRSDGPKLLSAQGLTFATVAAAHELSRLTGKPVGLMVGISPDGAEKITLIEQASEPVTGKLPSAGNSELDSALAEARRRGASRVSEILAGPEMLSADEFAERLGTTRATITAWRHKNQVLGLEGATRGFRFPEWQVGDDGKPFRVLPEIFDRLGGNPWAVYRFLVQRHPELGGTTGKDALRRGRGGQVVTAAESVARAFA